jgi:multisubunit Na+/H+ antiporter MnhB subunit
MSLLPVLACGLALLILAVAGWTMFVRETLASVIGFVVYGLLLTLAWVCLSSVDVALTEAAIGGGLTGALVLGACARLRSTEAAVEKERPGPLEVVAAASLCLCVSAGLAAVVLLLPVPAPTLAPAALAHLPSTGLGNPVTAVLMAYRSLDTLLEKVVLLLALVGVWSLAPDHLWGGRPGPRHQPEPDGVLVFLAQVLPPVGIVVGIYILWVGADAPGGAFQGGTLLAAMWVLAIIAGVTDPPPVKRLWLRLVLVAGPVVFLGIGLAGFVVASGFLAYPVDHAKPLIITIEVALTLSIAATLGLLVAGPPERPPEL